MLTLSQAASEPDPQAWLRLAYGLPYHTRSCRVWLCVVGDALTPGSLTSVPKFLPGIRLFFSLVLFVPGSRCYTMGVWSVRLACPTGSYNWLNRYWNLGRLAIGTKRRTSPNRGWRSGGLQATHVKKGFRHWLPSARRSPRSDTLSGLGVSTCGPDSLRRHGRELLVD